MTKDLATKATPPKMAKEVWPFCPECGRHDKTVVFRVKLLRAVCTPCFTGQTR